MPEESTKPTRYLFLIIFFGILVAIVAGSTAQHGNPPNPPPSNGISPLWLLGLIPAGLLTLIVLYLGYKGLIVFSSGDWIKPYNHAINLLHEGATQEALPIFQELEVKKTSATFERKMILTGLGTAHLYLNDTVKAVEYLEMAHGIDLSKRSALNKESQATVDRATDSMLMLTHLILGNNEAAQRCKTGYDSTQEEVALAFLTQDAYALCKCGQFSEAEEHIAALWNKASGQWLAFHLQHLRILRAFALKNLTQTPEREQNIKDLVAGSKPCRPGQFDFLCGRWPELKAFLVEHGFSS